MAKLAPGFTTSRGPEREDGDLLDRFLLGDLTAMDDLVERYQLPVYRLAYRMTRNRADAEDITQEVFVRAYRALASFRRASSLKTWLFRVAINCALTHQRGTPGPPEPAPHDAVPPEACALLEQRELHARLAQGIAQLPPVQRATVILRVVEGLSLKEIGEVVGSPIGTVKANYHHAVMRLRRLLREPSLR